MRNPKQMMKATNISLWIVFGAYLLMGELLSIIFWPSSHGIQGDVTSVLPDSALLSIIIKLSMTSVILCTTPLIIVPCGDLVQRKLRLNQNNSDSAKKWTGMIIRIFICILCAFLSVCVPNFVYVISFIGCLCVSLISYVYPPLAHIICFMKLNPARALISAEKWRQLYLDGIILPIGLISCILTSNLTFHAMMKNIENMTES